MSAFVLHDAQGAAQSIATGSPPSSPPSGLSAVVITDAEFSGLTRGTHLWDAASRTVLLDTVKAAIAANQQTVRSDLAAAMTSMQTIIDTAQVSFTTTAAAQTAMRALQTQVKDEARLLRRLVRAVVEDYSGTS